LTRSGCAEKNRGPRAFELLLESGRRALSHGALSTAEGTTLERARQAAPDAAARTEAEDSLTEALALAGKTDRVFELGGELLGPSNGPELLPSAAPTSTSAWPGRPSRRATG
jgi:hypothetical protein